MIAEHGGGGGKTTKTQKTERTSDTKFASALWETPENKLKASEQNVRSKYGTDSDRKPTDWIKTKNAREEDQAILNKGLHKLQSAALSNPVTRAITNPSQELRDELTMMKKGVKTVADLVGKGEAVFTDSDLHLEGETKKKNDFNEGLYYIGKALKKGADRVKKKFKKIFNHPEWYSKFPEFITSNLTWGIRKEYNYFPVAIGATVPVVLAIPQKNGAVSQAYIDMCAAAFAKLRGSNSGAFNYVSEDVAAYIEVTRGIRALHANLSRDITLLNNVDAYISKTPDALLSVAGYDASGIAAMKANRAQYVAELNQLAEIIDQTFPTFPDMTIYDRSIYLAKAILEDGKGPKSSTYCYTIHRVTKVESSGTNHLEAFQVSDSDFGTRLGYLRTLISTARTYVSAVYPNADTFSKIAGDMFKAYGQRALARTCDRITLNDKAAIVFDEYLLNQLQNSTSANSFDDVDATTTLGAFATKYQAYVTVAGTNNTANINNSDLPGLMTSTGALKPVLVTTHKSDISGAEALSLTRGIVVAKATATAIKFNTQATPAIQHSDGDILCTLIAYYYDSFQNISSLLMRNGSYQENPQLKPEIWSQLDYCPALYRFDDSGNNKLPMPLLDVDNYTFMTDSQIIQFNDTVVLSLYKSPDISDQVNFRSVKR